MPRQVNRCCEPKVLSYDLVPMSGLLQLLLLLLLLLALLLRLLLLLLAHGDVEELESVLDATVELGLAVEGEDMLNVE